MEKFKYGDKVIVIKDPENDGFFIGVTGVLVDYTKFKEGSVKYGVEFGHSKGIMWVNEDEIQKI